jgi:type IV fimbrial biogenesis protein FimT
VAKKKSAPVATNALCRPLAGADNGRMSNSDFASQRRPLHRAPRRGAQAGFNLMEVMVVAVIVAIMAVLAVPSFSGMAQRQRVKNAADAVLSDLRWARSEAIKRGQDVRVNITPATPATGWQYRIYVPSTQEELKRVTAVDFPNISIISNESNIDFNSIHGTAMRATITVSSYSEENRCADVVVSMMGRVRLNEDKKNDCTKDE